MTPSTSKHTSDDQLQWKVKTIITIMSYLVTSIWVLVRVIFFCQFPVCLGLHKTDLLAGITLIMDTYCLLESHLHDSITYNMSALSAVTQARRPCQTKPKVTVGIVSKSVSLSVCVSSYLKLPSLP